MNGKKKILVLLALIMTFAILASLAFRLGADFGDFGGDSDFGSFDFDSGSDSYDYDSGDDGGGAVVPIIIGGSGGNGRTGGNPIVGIIIVVAIIALIIFITRKKSNGPIMPGGQRTSAEQLKSIDELKAADPNFSEADICEKVSNLYVTLQNAWSARDIEPLRPYLTDELYAKTEKQVQSMKLAHRQNLMDKISVLSADVRGYYTDGVNDTLVIRLMTRLIDYNVDDRTGDVISGSKTAEKFMEYEWLMIRKSGTLTPDVNEGSKKEVKTANCPNCGAPIDIAHSAKCPYCGSVLHAKEYSWVLSEIKGIAQRTNGK